MQNKKLLVIAVGSLLFVLVILIVVLGAARSGTPKPGGRTPTAVVNTKYPSEQGALRVINTLPANGAQNINLNSEVVVNFNRNFTQNEVQVEFLDNNLQTVSYQFRSLGSRLTLIPEQPLEQSMVYTVRIRDQYVRTIGEINFLTQTITPSPDTRPVAAVTEIIIRNRQERPDIYLANLMPYEDQDFKMVLETDAEGYFTFVVTPGRLTGDLLKDGVKAWLLSLELTEAQISSLKFVYR